MLAEMKGVDAITFEIVRHRLWSIGDEMAQTLIRTAANPTITEANDFMVALYNERGEIALGGWGGNRHLSCIAVACRAILDRFSMDRVHEDDIFLLNDPYVAAVHQQDVYLISPIHVDGQLVGWTGNFTHLADVGGMNPGSSPGATDIRQEGLRIPGLKISDRGELRDDVLDSLLTMTREPEMNGLQLRAQLASNHTGKAKLKELIAEIGIDPYRAVLERMMAMSEEGLRARLRRIPDGTWRTRHYLDGSDRIYTIELAMTKEGDQLTFDYTGTSAQAANSINSTVWATRGGIFVAVSNLLCHELPWNEGLLKPITMIAPEGTLVNCTFPAPVSTSAYRVTEQAALNTVSAMLAMSDEFEDEITAQWSAGSSNMRITGINRENRFFLLTPFASTSAAGARRFDDGVDAAGSLANPTMSSANIETLERNAPILFLFRRYLKDSGGPGFNRGGASSETAMVIHKVPTHKLTCVLNGYGHDPAMSVGLLGGLPSPQIHLELFSGVDAGEILCRETPLDPEFFGGERHLQPGQGVGELREDDIQWVRQGGGGGIGDPLLRAPSRVLADVVAGLVSVDHARRVYGVVLDSSARALSEGATRTLREELRAERLGDAFSGNDPPLHEFDVARPVIYDKGKGLASCAACGKELTSLWENWKGSAIEHSLGLGDLGVPWNPSRFVLRSYSCPGCGTLLDCEMTLPADPPIFNYSPIVGT